jgi:hypothetical protein
LRRDDELTEILDRAKHERKTTGRLPMGLTPPTEAIGRPPTLRTGHTNASSSTSGSVHATDVSRSTACSCRGRQLPRRSRVDDRSGCPSGG